MSRFFRGGNESSSESSSDEEELYSEEEEEELEDEGDDSDNDGSGDDDSDSDADADAGGKKKGAAKFLVDDDSSDEEDSDAEVTTKVKSAKDKRLDELESTVTAIANGMKINDWGSIATGRSDGRWRCAKVQCGLFTSTD